MCVVSGLLGANMIGAFAHTCIYCIPIIQPIKYIQPKMQMDCLNLGMRYTVYHIGELTDIRVVKLTSRTAPFGRFSLPQPTQTSKHVTHRCIMISHHYPNSITINKKNIYNIPLAKQIHHIPCQIEFGTAVYVRITTALQHCNTIALQHYTSTSLHHYVTAYHEIVVSVYHDIIISLCISTKPEHVL